MVGADYQAVTETAGVRITREALAMALTRYVLAAGFCDGKRVLEAGCGAGQGLGILARRAACVVGGDYDPRLIAAAGRHYRERAGLVRLDAQALPFADHSFDVVILFEAIYYIARPDRFVSEARRVLDRAGTLIVCSANPERADFNPSPFSTRYLSARELAGLMRAEGFEPQLAGAFPIDHVSMRGRTIATLRKGAIAMGLMPKTMKGKQLLKRLFMGRLVEAPTELEGDTGTVEELSPLALDQPAKAYKVIFAVGRLSVAP
ncbi:MAG TPA: class I SAM-dependent methyltransferase [Candidatus Binataceae bacterium]|nr:class I SAM-dependent methyltransferase [Candidatus Binataceae bacterium]